MIVTLTLVALIANIILAAAIILMALYGAPVSALVASASTALAIAVVPVAVHCTRRWRRRPPETTDAAEPEESAEPIAKEQEVFDRELFKRCCDYMETKRPFLVEALTLGDLANAMFTNTFYLSRTINGCSGKNFRRFVNDYRVDYAMKIFRKNTSLKVAQLSVMSGFHNIVTFNMAFKLVKGVSPSVWCQSVRYGAEKGTTSP